MSRSELRRGWGEAGILGGEKPAETLSAKSLAPSRTYKKTEIINFSPSIIEKALILASPLQATLSTWERSIYHLGCQLIHKRKDNHLLSLQLINETWNFWGFQDNLV